MSNPMEAVDPVEVPKRELRFLTVEQIAELCRLAGPMYGTLFAVQALCGLRAGEVLALRWEDLDLTAGRLFVRRQVIWLRKKDVPAGETAWRFVEPKSDAGKRVVEIPAPLARGLELYRQWRNGAVRPDALLFATKDGTPLMQRNIRRRHFQPALKSLGLRDIRPHDFRRSFVALHVAAGTHPKLVQTRMGHSNINLTMDVYGRLAGDVALGKEETTKLNGLAEQAVTELANIWQTEISEMSQNGQKQTGGKKALTP